MKPKISSDLAKYRALVAHMKRCPNKYRFFMKAKAVCDNPREFSKRDLYRIVKRSAWSDILIKHYELLDCDSESDYESDETIAENG